LRTRVQFPPPPPVDYKKARDDAGFFVAAANLKDSSLRAITCPKKIPKTMIRRRRTNCSIRA
jgi:hypothetical protein